MKPTRLIKILSVLPAVLLTLSGWAQHSVFNWNLLGTNSNRLEGKLTGTIYYIPPLDSKQHFYYDGWQQGTVVLEDGDIFSGLQMNYLSKGDELVVYNPNLRQLFLTDKEKVKSFTVHFAQTEHKFVKLYLEGFWGGNRYFRVLYSGTKQLLAYHYVFEEKTRMYTDEHGNRRGVRLVPKTIYYIYSPDSGFKILKKKRSSFVRLFPEEKREVRRIFRRNNLRNFNETEMIEAFKLLDEAGFFNRL